MRTNVATAPRPTEGNDFATDFQKDALLETIGNSISRQCLIDAIGAVPHKVLAEELQMARGTFSKSLNGAPGGDFNYVLDNIRPEIRADYIRRMADAQKEGGLQELAAEALAHAAINFLSTLRMRSAKAGLR